MSRFEKLTLAVSVAAFVVSVLAAAASIWVYEKTTTSILRFGVAADFSQMTLRFERLTDGQNAVRFRKHGFLVLRNLGNAPLTVESVVLWPIKPNINNLETEEWRQAISHTGPWKIDTEYGPVDAIFASADGKPFAFPVTIEPRRVVRVEMTFNVPIARELWDKVKNRIPIGSDLDYSDVAHIFDAAGIPDWGYSAFTSPNQNSNVSSHFRYFVVRIVKEDGKELVGEFDILGGQPEQGE